MSRSFHGLRGYRLALCAAAALLLPAAPVLADCVTFHAFAVHEGTIDASVPGTITANTGNHPDYHWNKSSWAGRTGQKAFYSTSAFNGSPVSVIQELHWDLVEGYWGNAYFNVMVEDAGGKKAILAPSMNSMTDPGWGDMGANKNYAVFEAEAGWTGTAATGFYAATWDEVKDLIITDGPFTEFPDTLDGAATMQNDPVYTVENWAAWADLAAGGDFGWEKGGFLITFGQSTGTATPLTTIENISLTHSLACIDVRPGNDRNQINTRAKQLVPIAIFGTADFDPVGEIDLDSLLVRGASPIGTKFDTDDVNGDGYDDLTVYFRARSLDKPTEAECGDPDAKLELTGSTIGGQDFTGVDSVTWSGPDCP